MTIRMREAEVFMGGSGLMALLQGSHIGIEMSLLIVMGTKTV